MKNAGSKGQPSRSLAPRASSGPRGSPWALAVSWRVGQPKQMLVRTAMREGRPVSWRAAAMARAMAATSLPSATSWVCQPQAAKRARRSSVKARSVLPSMEMRLSS